MACPVDNVDGRMLAFVGGALHQSKIPASPELAAASAKQPVDQDEDGPLPTDVDAALAGILEACDGDPFLAVGSLIESGHAMPAETRSALAVCLGARWHPRSAWRRGSVPARPKFDCAPRGCRSACAGRRLADADRGSAADRDAQLATRERASRSRRGHPQGAGGWDRLRAMGAGSIEAIVATAVDGAAAQGFLLISPVGRKKRISSVLTKGGIADAWSGEPESRRQIETSLAAAGMDTPTLAVSRSYLDRIVAHELALSIEKREAPPFGLLQVAETIGGADWQPARMAFGETLAGLIAEVPKAMCEPAALASVLRKSNELAELEAVAQSWFEDDPQVAQAVERARGRDRAKLATYLLQSVIARHRDRWADIVLRTALWMREAPPEADLCWRELAIVAKALVDGRDMTEIGLMRDIALRTIAVLRDAGRM